MNTTETSSTDFDASEKERQLRSESELWDTSAPEDALDDDIPTINLDAYFSSGSTKDLDEVALELRNACEKTGFFSIVGHHVPSNVIENTFSEIRGFHSAADEVKSAILMDRPGWPAGGMGYLPLNNRKLPARQTGNLNEAFIIKCDDQLSMSDNQWPDAAALPDFRKQIERYAEHLEALGKRMLPIYARALGVSDNYFEEAFVKPLYRLRMTHYPAVPSDEQGAYGIAPHVDTSFCTILAQDQPGLSVFSERRKVWVNAPVVKDSFIVNTGELLKHWTNDRFLSTRHYANNNTGSRSRYSIPFFFNANPNYVMHCVPTCFDESNPAKYPPISYAQSQAVAQGE